jgi:hypothetical protein
MSDERIKVYPALGLSIRDEFTMQPIPAEGDEVPNTRLTARRIARGDLVLKDPRTAPEPSKKTKKDEG